MKLDPVILATVAVLIALLAISSLMFKPHMDNPVMIFREAPLEKNTEFQLRPGETYIYAYIINSSSQVNMTYSVLQGTDCTRIKLLESVNWSETCLDRWGMDDMGYNSALENPAILLFKPWMLALEEGWQWNSSMYLSFGGMEQHVSDTHYRVVRRDVLDGRDVFIVEIRMDDAPPEYQWIDTEKRVLLRIEGDGYTITRVE